MNSIVANIVNIKLYLWKLFHSLINYFFNLHIKNTYNINKNCYIFIKRLGTRNEILINYLNCEASQFYKKLHFQFIKFTMSYSRQIPIFNIKHIEIEPNIFRLDSIKQSFKLWQNCHRDAKYTINVFDTISNEFLKYFIFRLQTIDIYYNKFKFNISHTTVYKNSNKTRVFIADIKLYYNDIYIGRVKKLKISYDSIANRINVYGSQLLLIISQAFLKYPIISDLLQIYNQFNGDSGETTNNIYFCEMTIKFLINNHLILNLKECFFEKNILKCNANVKIWKKEIFWLNQCSYNILTNILSINNVRIRLFRSTADKIYKTFRPIYKFFVKRKINVRYKKSSKTPQDLHHTGKCNIDQNVINNNYFSNETVITPDSDDSPKVYKLSLNNNYITERLNYNLKTIFKIEKCTIDFQNNNGSFVFNQFTFSELNNGIHISCSKWLFTKNNLIYLNSVDDRSNFIIEYVDNSLKLYPYYMYLNLSIDVFSDTFSMFSTAISRIIDIFNLSVVQCNSYIFDKFYIHSTRLLFSYDSKPVRMINIICGKYFELINTLDITDLQFILKEFTLIYPKNGNYIMSLLMKHIIHDIFNNNFDTLMNSTPLSLTYEIKKKIAKIPGFTQKCYRLLNG